MYTVAHRVLPALAISNESIPYYDQVRTTLYGFTPPRQYPTRVLRPVRKINTTLLTEAWDNIQRILVSLALNPTTQSIIVGKLRAYARKHKTRRALWEYNNIMRSLSLFGIPRFPTSTPTGPARAQSRQELSALSRAVAYANFGKLRFRTEHDQHLRGGWSRPLTTCIIYDNASLFSNQLAFKEARGEGEGIALLARVSPVAGQHSNWYGRSAFRKPLEAINMHAILQALMHVPVPHDLAGSFLEGAVLAAWTQLAMTLACGARLYGLTPYS